MKKLKILVLSILAGLLFIIGTVFVVDPLYLYHGPIFGMNEALFESSLQVEGTIKNFEYDSVLIGSSMIENADVTVLESMYDCSMIKIAKQSGNTSDLLFYLDQVHKHKEITKVFWGIDLFALESEPNQTIPNQYTPGYLFTDSILDDYPYFFNKDILLEKLPNFLAYSLANKYGHEKSYSFADGKTFEAEFAMQSYERGELKEKQDFSKEIPVIEENINNIVTEIKNHPQITYRLFYSPYSLLWWDQCYRNGTFEKYVFLIKKSLEEFTKLENAEVYFFMQEKDIACNLDLYMDTQHFRPDINQYILTGLNTQDSHLVQKNDVERIEEEVRDFVSYIITDGIYKYYTK